MLNTRNLSFMALCLVLAGCQQAAPRGYRSFGAPIQTTQCVDIKGAVAKASETSDVPVCVEGKIAEVCRKMGCWMTLTEGDDEIIVRFTASEQCSDGFFVPRNSDGHHAYVYGKLERGTISEDMARHYAEDEGQSPEQIAKILGPQPVNSMIVTGVMISDADKLDPPVNQEQ